MSTSTEAQDCDLAVAPKGAPPSDYPWRAMASLCMGMLAHSVVFTAPLPFVAFMVVDFEMASSVDEAGYYAGWITGTFMIGRTVAGLAWGVASDRFGRRACLLITMFNVALFGLLLGFSTSFGMAVALRLAIGLGNGFMGIAKTCVSEICSKEHELRGFGMLNGIWGLGLIVGPAIGGLLSRPAIQYPQWVSRDSLWGTYPYLLPCLVCSVLAVIAFMCIFLWLPETAGIAVRKDSAQGQEDTGVTGASRGAESVRGDDVSFRAVTQTSATVADNITVSSAMDKVEAPGTFVIEGEDEEDEEDDVEESHNFGENKEYSKDKNFDIEKGRSKRVSNERSDTDGMNRCESMRSVFEIDRTEGDYTKLQLPFPSNSNCSSNSNRSNKNSSSSDANSSSNNTTTKTADSTDLRRSIRMSNNGVAPGFLTQILSVFRGSTAGAEGITTRNVPGHFIQRIRRGKGRKLGRNRVVFTPLADDSRHGDDDDDQGSEDEDEEKGEVICEDRVSDDGYDDEEEGEGGGRVNDSNRKNKADGIATTTITATATTITTAITITTGATPHVSASAASNDPADRIKPKNLQGILTDPHITLLASLYTSLCFSVMFIDETFPLWAVSSVAKGGLSWSSAEVGSSLACMGCILVVFQLFFYEPFIKTCCVKGSARTFFRLCTISAVAISLLVEAAHTAQRLGMSTYFTVGNDDNEHDDAAAGYNNAYGNYSYYNSHSNATGSALDDGYYYISNGPSHTHSLLNSNNPSKDSSFSVWILYLTVVFMLTAYRATATSAFTTIGLVINASVDRELRGTLNGLMMTFGSLGNAVGPITGAMFYAFSLTLPKLYHGRIVFLTGAMIIFILGVSARRLLHEKY